MLQFQYKSIVATIKLMQYCINLVAAKMLLYCNINVLNLVRDTGFALALY
jgi:hypothetical protein